MLPSIPGSSPQSTPVRSPYVAPLSTSEQAALPPAATVDAGLTHAMSTQSAAEHAAGAVVQAASGVEAERAPGVRSSLLQGLAVSGMVALSLGGALAAPPALAAPEPYYPGESKTTSRDPYYAADTRTKAADTFPGYVTTRRSQQEAPAAAQQTSPAQPVAPSVAPPQRSEREVIHDTSAYIHDMLSANIVQGQALNTYQKSYLNDLNTMQRIEAQIQANPASLSDPAIRRSHQLIKAALDTVQVFTYQTSTEVVHSRYGQMTTNVQTHHDYSGPAALTRQTLENVVTVMSHQGQR